MKVLLLARYSRSGSSSRVRCYQYLPKLEEAGIRVTSAPLSDEAYLTALYSRRPRSLLALLRSYGRRVATLLTAGGYDLVWIERELFPMAPAIAEAVLNRLRIPYVIDYDDAVFHNYDLHPSRLVRRLLGRKIDHAMRNATLVIAGNDYLADRAQRVGAPWIEQIPSVVDLSNYPNVERSADGAGPFTVGWIGTPLNVKYLSGVRDTLVQLSLGGAMRLLLVGSGPVRLPGIDVVVARWTEETQAEEIRKFDVGVMPIPDEPFERGKCGYKLLQYFACQVPAVASPVGVNQRIVREGVNGFLAGTSSEWTAALARLRDNPELRRRMGSMGRQDVESGYSLNKAAPRLIELFRIAAERKPSRTG